MHNRAFKIDDEQPDSQQPRESAPTMRVLLSHVNPRPSNPSREESWLSKQLSVQCGCANNPLTRALSLAILLLLSWLVLFVLFGAEVLPGGGLFTLLSLFLLAQLVGNLLELVKLPAVLGMLLTGIILRTLGFYNISGVYLSIVSTLRELSLGVILLKAGLGLDPVALVNLSFTVLRLAVCPGLMEAVTVAFMTHYFLGYPWPWGFALGFLLCAISPAVVVPTLLKLKKKGYGEGKGISTLVIAASSLDDVLAISVFAICISMIFSTGESLASQLLQGPLDVVVGLTIGAVWGLICGLTPHLDDEYLVCKRAVMVGGAGLCAVLGSASVGYPGAGPLVCITAALTASMVWGAQGWTVGEVSMNPVEAVFSEVWTLLEPVLFGLIGAEIDLKVLRLESLTWGVAVIVTALGVRVVTCSLVLVGGKLNFKEVVFVNLAWIPKATVQAALAPQALDMVRKMSHPLPDDLQRGAELLSIAVLSILITAPLGSIGASIGGPRLLAKAPAFAQPEEETANL